MVAKKRRPASFRSVVKAGLRSCDRATTTDGKGRALESLITAMFLRVPGVERVLRNTLNAFATEEIDVAIGNEGDQRGLIGFPDVILVECKNWSNAVGSVEVAYFTSRLRQRGCMCGILVAMNGITGDSATLTAARFEIASALKERIRVIVLKRQEIEVLSSPKGLVELLKSKTLELVAAGTTI